MEFPNRLKFLEDVQARYDQFKPRFSPNPLTAQDEFLKLSNLEKSYYLDMQRMIDEVKALNKRHEDFAFVLQNIPDHELISKVNSGELKPEDKAPYQK